MGVGEDFQTPPDIEGLKKSVSPEVFYYSHDPKLSHVMYRVRIDFTSARILVERNIYAGHPVVLARMNVDPDLKFSDVKKIIAEDFQMVKDGEIMHPSRKEEKNVAILRQE